MPWRGYRDTGRIAASSARRADVVSTPTARPTARRTAPPAAISPIANPAGARARRSSRLTASDASTASAAWRPVSRLAPPDAGQRLLHRVDGEHAEAAGHAGLELDVLDPARGLAADVVVVVGLAADHRAEADDRVVAAGLGGVLGDQRQLERAGHVEHVDLADARPPRARRARPPRACSASSS